MSKAPAPLVACVSPEFKSASQSLLQEVERRPVGVARGRRRCLAVPVVHEALRRCNSLEDCVWRAHQVTANHKNPVAPIVIEDAENGQASPIVGQVADIVIWQWGRARRLLPTHQPSHHVCTTTRRRAYVVKPLPSTAA